MAVSRKKRLELSVFPLPISPTIIVEKVILTKHEPQSCVLKTGYCSSVLLSCVSANLCYFKPTKCQFKLAQHCSITCNCLDGTDSFVCARRWRTWLSLFWTTSVWRKVIPWLCCFLIRTRRSSVSVWTPGAKNIIKVVASKQGLVVKLFFGIIQ